MNSLEPNNRIHCRLCRQIFRTHQALLSHLESSHGNESDVAFYLSRRQNSMHPIHTHPNLNSNSHQTTAFQNNYHNYFYNQTRGFQNAIYPAAYAAEISNFQMPMTINSNSSFIAGHPVLMQLPLRSFHPQVQSQPQTYSQPQSHPQPRAHHQPQAHPQLRAHHQPHAHPQPQVVPQVQDYIVEYEMSLRNKVCTLPLIEQLERKWPETIALRNGEEDVIDLELKL